MVTAIFYQRPIGKKMPLASPNPSIPHIFLEECAPRGPTRGPPLSRLAIADFMKDSGGRGDVVLVVVVVVVVVVMVSKNMVST